MAALYFYACFILKLTLVAGQPVHYVLKGKEVVLSPVLSHAPDDILWKHNGDKVISFDGAEERVFPPYEGRVTLGWRTAELTIADVGYEDSGEYELDALVRDKWNPSQHMLKVLDKVSKPVIRCEVSDESGNSTSVRRATLLCSSESDTPETLTFKWKLEEQSHLGQSLSISLGQEHDHMEYSCIATNPLDEQTSVFTAKDCYTAERSSQALDIVVPIVIASLILLAFCIFPFIFRHQIKRACLKQRKNNDLEKQITETDDKSKVETVPLMGDIHRQETFASKQPLIQQKEFETPQKQETAKDMDMLKSEGKVKKGLDIFANREQMEPRSNTQAEEENEAGISEMATSPPASPIRNDSDSHNSSEHFDTPKPTELQSPLDSDPQALQIVTHEHESDLDNSNHEAAPETHTADDHSSINIDQDQTTKAPKEEDSLPQSPHHSNEFISGQNSQPEPVKSENVSTSAPKLTDPQTNDQQNKTVTSEQEEAGKSQSASDPNPPELLAPLPSNPSSVQTNKVEASPVTESVPLNNAPQTDSNHESGNTDNNIENIEGTAQTDVAQKPPHSVLPGVDGASSQSELNANPDSRDDKQTPVAGNEDSEQPAPSSLPSSSASGKEDKQKTGPKTESDPEHSDPQTDSDHENVSSDNNVHNTEGGAENAGQQIPYGSVVTAGKASLESDLNKNGNTKESQQSSTAEKRLTADSKDSGVTDEDTNAEEKIQNVSSEESNKSKPTSTTEITPTAGSEVSGSQKESAESTHSPASALNISAVENNDSGAENASSAQVSVETKGNADKETDSSNSEQRHETGKEGQQQS